jgi:dihydrolipoamide dehydrogenase
VRPSLGLKTAVVEKASRLGGVCLNVGCIPSKALLDSSEYYHLARDRFAEYGIKTGKVTLDLAAMLARKDKVVAELTENVRKLLEGNGIEIIHGTASIPAQGGLSRWIPAKKKDQPVGQNILLATGSEPIEVKGLEFDGKRISSVPPKPSISAAYPNNWASSAAGTSVWNWDRCGAGLVSTVTVIEMLPKIATTLDGQVGRTLDRILKRQGLAFKLNTKVAEAKVARNKVKTVLESGGEYRRDDL